MFIQVPRLKRLPCSTESSNIPTSVPTMSPIPKRSQRLLNKQSSSPRSDVTLSPIKKRPNRLLNIKSDSPPDVITLSPVRKRSKKSLNNSSSSSSATQVLEAQGKLIDEEKRWIRSIVDFLLLSCCIKDEHSDHIRILIRRFAHPGALQHFVRCMIHARSQGIQIETRKQLQKLFSNKAFPFTLSHHSLSSIRHLISEVGFLHGSPVDFEIGTEWTKNLQSSSVIDVDQMALANTKLVLHVIMESLLTRVLFGTRYHRSSALINNLADETEFVEIYEMFFPNRNLKREAPASIEEPEPKVRRLALPERSQRGTVPAPEETTPPTWGSVMEPVTPISTPPRFRPPSLRSCYSLPKSSSHYNWSSSPGMASLASYRSHRRSRQGEKKAAPRAVSKKERFMVVKVAGQLTVLFGCCVSVCATFFMLRSS